ncbi:hypothetical protein HKD37_18G050824 [Glycine soja]
MSILRLGKLKPTRKVSTTLYAKSTTLARRSEPNFVRLTETLPRRGYEYLENKLMDEKRKKKLVEAAQCRSTNTVIDPPSPIRRHVKWKMTHTKKTRQMTSEARKEIAEKIDLLEEQASQGSFVAHGRQDVLTVSLGRPEHPGRVRAAGAGVTIKQYFGPSPRTSHMSSSMAPEDIQSQGLALPPEPKVGPSAACVRTKESCVDPSGNDPNIGDSDKCGLYVKENPPGLVALGRLYKGSTTVHNISLLHDQVKVGVEKVRHTDAPILVPTEESIQRSGQSQFESESYIKNWMQNSKRDVYLGANLNGPDNYLKRIINSVLKELDNTTQSKSNVTARWIVVKVSNLNNYSSYILVLCRLIYT